MLFKRKEAKNERLPIDGFFHLNEWMKVWNKLVIEHPKPVSIEVGRIAQLSVLHLLLIQDVLITCCSPQWLKYWLNPQGSSLSGVRKTGSCRASLSLVGLSRQRHCASPEVVGTAQNKEAHQSGRINRTANHSSTPWTSPHGRRAWVPGSQKQAGQAMAPARAWARVAIFALRCHVWKGCLCWK